MLLLLNILRIKKELYAYFMALANIKQSRNKNISPYRRKVVRFGTEDIQRYIVWGDAVVQKRLSFLQTGFTRY